MKNIFIFLCLVFSISYCNYKSEKDMRIITIQVGHKVFRMKLFNTQTTNALIEQMPFTLNMNDLNENEKYYHLNKKLPINPQGVEKVKTGDLMLFGNDSLVLFYKSFDTSYRYTRLGYIEDAAGLEEELGKGSVQIKFILPD